MKKGDVFWSIHVENGKIEADEHHVSVIRKNVAYITQFIRGTTWIKKSTKQGHFGWAPNISLFRHRCWDEKVPFWLFKTKKEATEYRIEVETDDLEGANVEGWTDEIAEHELNLKALNRYLKRQK